MLDECIKAQGFPYYRALIEKEYEKSKETIDFFEERAINNSLKINREHNNEDISMDKKSVYKETLIYRYAIHLSQNLEEIIEIEVDLKKLIQLHTNTKFEINKNDVLSSELKYYHHLLNFYDPETLPIKDCFQELKQLVYLMLFRTNLEHNDIKINLLISYINSRHTDIESFKKINKIKAILQENPTNSIFTAELDTLYFGIDYNNINKKDPLEEYEVNY